MQLLDSLIPMIDLVEKAGKDSETEKYILVSPDSARSFLRVFKKSSPKRLYRVRNEKHARGIAERRNLSITVRDLNSDLTLSIEVGYRVACITGHELIVAETLTGDSTPGELFDQIIEGWIKDFARGEPSFFQSIDSLASKMSRVIEGEARDRGFVLKLFLERVTTVRKVWAFSLPISFKGEIGTTSVGFRLAVFASMDEAAVSRARLNELPTRLEQEVRIRIQDWFGANVLRDTLDRLASEVGKNLKDYLDSWLRQFGLQCFVEAIDADQKSKPDVAHTVRVDGIVSLGHFQWQVRTTMEISDAAKFLKEKRERQISEIHIWLGEQYPEFCWNAVRMSGGDASKFTEQFEAEVKAAVESIGYRLKNSILRRVLSEVELDARKQYLDSNLSQDQFLTRLIEGTRQKLINAYDSDDDSEQIADLETRLKRFQAQKSELIKEIAATRSDAKNLLPAATADAIGAERRTWTAISDGSAEAAQIEAPKKKATAANGEAAGQEVGN